MAYQVDDITSLHSDRLSPPQLLLEMAFKGEAFDGRFGKPSKSVLKLVHSKVEKSLLPQESRLSYWRNVHLICRSKRVGAIMILRIMGWAASVVLLLRALFEQLVRSVGPAPTFSFDLSVPNAVAIPTFLIGIAACLGVALSRERSNQWRWALLTVAMLVPIWLSTRHVWVPFGNASMIEHNSFLPSDWIDPDADPETVCYIEQDGRLSAVANTGAGPKLWSVHLGVWPWVIKNEDYDIMTDLRMCKAKGS